MLLRLAGSPGLRTADAVVVSALILIVVTGGYAALVYYSLTHPGFTPYLDRKVLEQVFAIQTRIAIPGWIGLLALALLLRRRQSDSRWLAHATSQFYFVQIATYAYFLGFYTDLFGAMTLLAGMAAGCLLFEARVVRAGGISALAIVIATTLAEQAGFLPYAPAFDRSPVEAGQLTATWIPWGSFGLLILAVVGFSFIGAMQLARDRERQLERATALIRRYVPAQLAESILAGQHAGAVQPERRKLTLFFSDVVGFTEAADRMEPEDLSSLLNAYLSEMAAIADAFGATVNQFVGDAIMAFFGAPEVTDDRDHALRAVRMALAMQRRMAELRERWFADGVQTPFRIRIGINTGVASVGDFGSRGRTTYSAIGNQTNLTARIQDHCEPGSVLISHTTWALVKDEIPCQERGEIEVKGLHYPVRVYRVSEAAGPRERDT